MSMSIPVFFVPVHIKKHVVVDGGMLSNFPVWLFDSDGTPDWPTFGLKLVEPDPRTPISERISDEVRPSGGLGALVAYAKGLVATMTEFYDRLYLEKDTFVRTITIPTLGIATTDFDLTRAQAEQLYDSGREAAEKFLASWNFSGYVAEYRSGKDHSRRSEVAEEINQEPLTPEAVAG
jgi:NTE family protein